MIDKLLVLSMPRSGTHLFNSLVSPHLCRPVCVWNPEFNLVHDSEEWFPCILRKYGVGWVSDFVGVHREVFGVQSFGELLFPSYLGFDNPYWGWLRGQGDVVVVHLVRRNFLRRLISHNLARSSGVWHTWRSVDVPRRTYVNCARLLEFLRVDKCVHEWLGWFFPDCVRVVYEDFVVDLEGACLGLGERLGVVLDVGVVPYRRINPFSVEESVFNFREVCGVLEGSEFEWMLWD